MKGRKTQKKRPPRDRKPKICRFCENRVSYIDFKDQETLRKFQTEMGRILPRRITGTCLEHQRMLGIAVKRARVIGLVL
jgi:small subunit ribosomal protein S18